MPRPTPAPTLRTVSVDGSRVEPLEAGRGDPLLLPHGWGLSPRSTAGAIRRLCDNGSHVLAPGPPGAS